MTTITTTLAGGFWGSWGRVLLPLLAGASSVLFLRGRGIGTNIEIRVIIHHPSDEGADQPQLLRGSSNTIMDSSDGKGTTSMKAMTTGDDKGPIASLFDGTTTIPSCARDVFVTLHNDEATGVGRTDSEQRSSSCRGMLLRDDILLTSRECSRGSSFTFDFAGVGVLRATPHTSLNAKELVANSRVGFLEANPPHHRLHVHERVRRTRMFLSLESNPNVNSTSEDEEEGGSGNSRAIFTCRGTRPVAHNFPVGPNGEMVPLGKLHDDGILPDDILWEHSDLHIAPELEFNNQRWWTKRVHLSDEKAKFHELIDRYSGPPGSISIPGAHAKFVSRASALCEALDPRGHRRDQCFPNYFTRWHDAVPFSGESFFDWLDFGSGKRLLEGSTNGTGISGKHEPMRNLTYMKKDEKCSKKDFNRKKNMVHYFDDDERGEHEVYLSQSQDGTALIARYKHNDELVPKSEADEPHLYMWDLERRLYVIDSTWDKRRDGTIKHSGLMASRPGLSAGKVYVGEGGAVWGVNYSSGHYRPSITAASTMYRWMTDEKFNVTALHWVGRKSWSVLDCFVTNWTKTEVEGFTAEGLNRACLEMTKGPTWILKEDV